jgi:hypothetical protein
MAPVEFSEEWNLTCALRPATVRNENGIGEPYTAFNWFLIAISSFLLSSTVILYTFAWRRFTYVRKRSYSGLWFTVIGVILQVCCGPIRDLIGRTIFPCSASLWCRIGCGK